MTLTGILIVWIFSCLWIALFIAGAYSKETPSPENGQEEPCPKEPKTL
jgi:hypothetical protein